MVNLTQNQWVKHTVIHPFEGFENLRWKKAGSLRISFLIIIMLFFATIADERLYGFQFYESYDKTFNIVPYIVKSVVVFAAWVVGNWSVCTLLDGEGTMKNICIYSSYSLIPYVLQIYINVILSHVLISDELIFMEIIRLTGTAWSILLLFMAIKAVHQYTFTKTILAVVLTIAAMLIMLFLLVLFMSLIQQVYIFISTLYTEITYRIRV